MKSDHNQANKKYQHPSVETLRRLFAVADMFRELAPWRWMGDREVVAVHDPHSKRIGYCIVMGGKICFGLDVMIGDYGLLEYKKTVSGKFDPNSFDDFHKKDSIVLLLESDKYVEPADRAYYDKIGATYSDKELCPRFRRYEPGFYPWLLDESSAAFMAVCLEQVAEVASRAKVNSSVLGKRDYQSFVVRIPQLKNGKFVWREEFISPEPMKRVIRIMPNKVDPAILWEVYGTAKKTKMTWEADCFWGTQPIGEMDERPRYPFRYMIAEHESMTEDYVLLANLFDVNDYGARFLVQMYEAMRKAGACPETILIRHQHLVPVFAPLLGSLGISTKVVKSLPSIEKARQEMFNAFLDKQDWASLKKSPIEQKNKKIVKASGKKQVASRAMGAVYQFKVTLDDIQPVIWRRFQVESDITLKRLAATILIVVGWSNSHLHQFSIGKKRYGLPEEDFMEYDDFFDEGKFRLSDFSEKELAKVNFAYDFGDGWTHTVQLEKVSGKHKDVSYPVCIGGARKCPRENCGGPAEYENFLRIISDPKDPEYPATIYDVGKDFNPEMFDVDSVNRQLKDVADEEKSFDTFA